MRGLHPHCCLRYHHPWHCVCGTLWLGSSQPLCNRKGNTERLYWWQHGTLVGNSIFPKSKGKPWRVLATENSLNLMQRNKESNRTGQPLFLVPHQNTPTITWSEWRRRSRALTEPFPVALKGPSGHLMRFLIVWKRRKVSVQRYFQEEVATFCYNLVCKEGQV